MVSSRYFLGKIYSFIRLQTHESQIEVPPMFQRMQLDVRWRGGFKRKENGDRKRRKSGVK